MFKVLRREGFILPGSEKRRIKNGSRGEETLELGFREQVGVHQMGQIREEKQLEKERAMGAKQYLKGIDLRSLLYRK